MCLLRGLPADGSLRSRLNEILSFKFTGFGIYCKLQSLKLFLMPMPSACMQKAVVACSKRIFKIYTTQKKRQPLAQNLNVVWKYEEEGFGKSLLHVLFQTFKNVRNTIMYTRCEYNYTNKRNTWRKYRKKKIHFWLSNSAYMMHFRPFPPIFLLLAFFAKPSTSAALHKSYFWY